MRPAGQQNNLILITGFMASGKTVVAKALGNLLNCPAIDLDELITTREGRPPQELIEEDGEAEFRKLESQALAEALANPAGVIALGGGAWMVPENRTSIARSNGITVWLNTPFELCWQRILASGSTRPLARERERAEDLFLKRRPTYQLAQLHIVPVNKQSAAEVARTIAKALERSC